jgi:branched-chain amino acid transport system permease protein
VTLTALAIGVLSGLALGAILVLISTSFTLVLAASGVFNFAQGTIVMGGSIVAYELAEVFHLPILAVVAVVLIAGAGSGLVIYLAAVRPAAGRSRSFTHTTMLTTIGLGLAANAGIALIFGGDTKKVSPIVNDIPLLLAGIPLRPTYLIIIVCGLVVTLFTEVVIRRTRIGQVFRVTLEDPEYARLTGINTNLVIAVTFILAGALAALAGFLIAPVIGASAFAGQNLAFAGFAAMAIGGFGSFAGALIGGLIAGMVMGLTPIFTTPFATQPLLWSVVVFLLLIRPGGLLGTAGLFGATKDREV